MVFMMNTKNLLILSLSSLLLALPSFGHIEKLEQEVLKQNHLNPNSRDELDPIDPSELQALLSNNNERQWETVDSHELASLLDKNKNDMEPTSINQDEQATLEQSETIKQKIPAITENQEDSRQEVSGSAPIFQ